MKCTFKPYEGELPYIFVSYAHKNANAVYPILERLNVEGFRIWYDEGIEWGTEWPQSIAEHLGKCAVCIAFHSNYSINSPNCRQEINYALKQGKDILSIYLEDVILSEGMDMQLTSYQSTFPYQYNDIELFYERLISTSILMNCKCLNTFNTLEWRSQVNNKSNFDVQINEFLEKIEVKEESDLKIKMEKIKSRHYIETFLKNLSKISVKNVDDVGNIYNIVPYDFQNNEMLLANSEVMNKAKSRFSLARKADEKLLVFLVNARKDYCTQQKYFQLEELELTEECVESDIYKVTFYVDDKFKEGYELIVVALTKNEAFINVGILGEGTVRLSKMPMSMTYKTFHSDMKIDLSSTSYTGIDSAMAKRDKDSEMLFEANLSKVPAIVIDPIKGLVIKRTVFYDKSSRMLKAKINIEPNKSYFIFNIQEPVKLLTNLEIAYAYKNGEDNFPKDFLKAVEYYEKDGSAVALYEIAMIFKNEDIYQDTEIYIEYLERAMNLGLCQAFIEYWIDSYKHKKFENIRLPMDEPITSEYKKGDISYTRMMFLYAIFCELGVCKNLSGRDLFDMYFEAASNMYKPAMMRLDLDDADNTKDLINNQYDRLKEKFYDGVHSRSGICKCILGSILFFGIDTFGDKQTGIELLKEASSEGCINAQYTLHTIYESDHQYNDSKLALIHLRVLANSYTRYAIKLANWLLDGKGCILSEEYDQEAFAILHNASLEGNKVAINNLGWMFLKGRGCQINYDIAKRLFKKGVEMGVNASYRWLGEMYERGLGSEKDIQKAIYYYKKGAILGNLKCEEQLNALIMSCKISD